MTHRDLTDPAVISIGPRVLDTSLKAQERLLEMYAQHAAAIGLPETAACLRTAKAAVEDSREELAKGATR